MIVHLFNSSSISGPERLVLPALAGARTPCVIVNLREGRIARLRESDPLQMYALSLNLLYRAVDVDSRWDRRAMDELHRLLRQLAPDLVHAHAIKASVYLHLARGRRGETRFRTVSTHHGIHGLPDWKVWLYELLYRRVFLKSFDRVLAVSTADYEFLVNSGFDKSRLRLHLNGADGRWIDAEHRSEESQKARALWLPRDLQGYRPFLFGVIARLSPEKDHARLLRVLACLNQRPCNRDWRCLIFGSGALEAELRQQAAQLGLERRVLWMGYRNDVVHELAGIDLLLSFSKAEGLPINLIEAGWAGTPVMCTRVGGITDLIPDESYGHCFPDGEPEEDTAASLLRFLSHEGQAELEDQALRFQRRVTTEFTERKWLQRLTEIYSELGVTFDGRSSSAMTKDSRKGDQACVSGVS